MAKLNYDLKNDLLSMHNGFEQDEHFLTNEVFGDLVLDISTKKRIVGFELLHASAFLERFGIKLPAVTEAEFEGEIADEKVVLRLTLQGKAVQLDFPLVIA